MKKALTIILLSFLVCFSTEINAQSTLSKEYLELIKNVKPLSNSFGKQAEKTTFKMNSIGGNKMVLPLDNMICVLPQTDTKFHILLAKPLGNDEIHIAIPNAIPNIEIVK